MSRGLSRSQIGVTESMVESFGETIFRLSHNLQRRRGDPIRLKDFDAVERQARGPGGCPTPRSPNASASPATR